MIDRFVAVITGASSGIGQSVAIEVASRGYDVIIHAKSNVAGLSDTALAIANKTPEAKVISIVSDLTCFSSASRLVDTAFNRCGRVDAWIHSAGQDVLTGEARDWSFDRKLNALWEMDVAATIRISRWVAGKMIHQPKEVLIPSIVHLGWDQSSSGMEGDSGQYFCAVKGAIEAFSKSLAKTVSPHVRVNTVAPGWIQTDWGKKTDESWNARATGESLLARWGTPADVAKVIGCLCSKECEFINGQTLSVNGGWTPMSLSARCNATYD